MAISSSIRSTLVGLALATVAVFAVAAPASAHDALDSSDPVSGAVLDLAPTHVTLNFTAEIMPEGAAAQVFEGTDPVAAAQAGAADWVDGAPSVVGMTMTVPLAADIPAGTYSVNWRVVSSDGHPISTSTAPIVTFTIEAGAAPTVETTAPESNTPAATETPTAEPTVEVSPGPAEADDDGAIAPAILWTLIIGGIVVVGLITTIVVVSRRPRA